MRLRKALVAVLVFLIALEGVLQVGALVMAGVVTPPAAPAGGSVLCVGDSYTFGVGATSPGTSYPAQLQKQLAAHGIADSGVVNAGFPGQHSGEVLSKLPAQLTPSTRVLCVLVGTNDSWRRPPRVDLAELARAAGPDGSFRWCWRTARLFQLITRFEAGTWQQSGGAAATPAPAGPAPADTALGFAELARWGLATGDAYVGRYEPDRTLPVARNDAFTRCMEAGDFARALVEAEQNTRQFPDSPLALQHLVTAAARSGRNDQAQAAVERLVQLGKNQPSAAATECLLEAYATTGQPERAIVLARQHIAARPLSIMAWDTLQRAAFGLGRRDDCLEAMPETIRLLGRREPWHTGFIARNVARLWFEQDPAKAVGLLVGAHFIDADAEQTRIAILVASPIIARARFDTALAAIGGPASAAKRTFGEVLDEVYASKGADLWKATLREHFAAMRDLAARRGVAMVLLSYPFEQQQVEELQRTAAQVLGVPFLSIRERFDRELKTRKHDELFVADGHCNDAGYAIMAELVAEAVAPLLAR
jgi:lysophospholipase L1-like esterase